METWFIIIVSLCIAAVLKSTINLLTPQNKLPPGPPTFPLIGNIVWLRKSFSELEPIIRSFRSKFGPLVTIHIGSRPAIFIADRHIAHQALVQNGAIFATRPPALVTNKFTTSNQHNISASFYGPLWRLLRRNLTSEILHPSRVKSYSHARKWVFHILLHKIQSQAVSGVAVTVITHFQYAMFCLLVLMCFGDKLDEKQIKKIEEVERKLILSLGRFNILNFWPRVTKILFCKKWEELYRIRRDQEDVLIPLIRARREFKHKGSKEEHDEDYVLPYVDTLLDLQIPVENNRKLTETEIVSLCNEFLNAGTDTTSTALQWIMANLVKYPKIQEKLYMEMKGVVRGGEREVKEEDLQKLPYLKALILEGLRRHPPAHFVLPHAVTEDATLNNYVIPKHATVNLMLADFGWDPKVWEEPMEFKPERFMDGNGDLSEFDITGSREIKMAPFGVGRRICPGYGLAMLHLEYFVANLVWNFEWTSVDGDGIDLSEKQEFTTVMKNPLKAQVFPRTSSETLVVP